MQGRVVPIQSSELSVRPEIEQHCSMVSKLKYYKRVVPGFMVSGTVHEWKK